MHFSIDPNISTKFFSLFILCHVQGRGDIDGSVYGRRSTKSLTLVIPENANFGGSFRYGQYSLFLVTFHFLRLKSFTKSFLVHLLSEKKLLKEKPIK